MLVAPGAPVHSEEGDVPRVMTLRSKGDLDLLMLPTEATACFVCRPVAIGEIGFRSTTLAHRGMELFDNRYSPVREGEIRFDDIPDKSTRIGARELPDVKLEEGVLRRILRQDPRAKWCLRSMATSHDSRPGSVTNRGTFDRAC